MNNFIADLVRTCILPSINVVYLRLDIEKIKFQKNYRLCLFGGISTKPLEKFLLESFLTHKSFEVAIGEDGEMGPFNFFRCPRYQRFLHSFNCCHSLNIFLFLVRRCSISVEQKVLYRFRDWLKVAD